MPHLPELMLGHGKETDTLDLGAVVGPNGGILNLALDSHKYQRPKDCSCGVSYSRHGTDHPRLPEALASWREVYFRERYYHRQTGGQCDNDGKSLKIGPSAHLSEWSEPLLGSLYVLGLSYVMISNLLPEDVISQAAVWRAVHINQEVNQEGINLHNLLHEKLQDDLNIWGKEDQRKSISEFYTMRAIDPPTAGLEVEVRRPIHQFTKRWIDERVLRSLHHPTGGNLSFDLS